MAAGVLKSRDVIATGVPRAPIGVTQRRSRDDFSAGKGHFQRGQGKLRARMIGHSIPISSPCGHVVAWSAVKTLFRQSRPFSGVLP